MQVKVGDKVEIIAKNAGGVTQYIKIGTLAKVLSLPGGGRRYYTVEGQHETRGNKIQQSINKEHFKQTKTMTTTSTLKRDAVMNTAKKLAKVQNTFTTLELKVQLRIDYKDFYWKQDEVSDTMKDFSNRGVFSFVDNGVYRTYSLKGVSLLPKVIAVKQTTTSKVKALKAVKAPAKTTSDQALLAKFGKGVKISRAKALALMQNNKGHFFSAVFTKQDGTLRLINGQYVKDQKVSPLGYVLVKEANKLKAKDKEPIRNINLQTLKVLKIAGQVYNF